MSNLNLGLIYVATLRITIVRQAVMYLGKSQDVTLEHGLLLNFPLYPDNHGFALGVCATSFSVSIATCPKSITPRSSDTDLVIFRFSYSKYGFRVTSELSGFQVTPESRFCIQYFLGSDRFLLEAKAIVAFSSPVRFTSGLAVFPLI